MLIQLGGDEKKRSIDVELQVPNEGERKSKKPRSAESLSAEEKKIEDGEIKNSFQSDW